MRKPKIVDHRLVGLRILPGCLHGIYRLRWDNGKETYEQGRTVYGNGFSSSKKNSLGQRIYRSDLGTLLCAVQPIVTALEDACEWADAYVPPKKRKRKKPKLKKRPPTRIVEV